MAYDTGVEAGRKVRDGLIELADAQRKLAQHQKIANRIAIWDAICAGFTNDDAAIQRVQEIERGLNYDRFR